MPKVIELEVPRWAGLLYAIMAVLLVPWILILAEYLPARHYTDHWDVVWVGYDVILLVALIITTYFMMRRSIWVIMAATCLATLLIVDAWFDILTSRPGRQQHEAMLSGVIELSLALLTYRLVYRATQQATPHKNIKLKATDSPPI